MNDQERSKNGDLAKSCRKKLESEPDNWVYQRLLEMAEGPREPFKPDKRLEIEEEDPQVEGREGQCDVALEVLLEFYPRGEPHRLTTDGNDFAHVFLVLDGKPMDICGITTLDEMRAHYKINSLRSEPVSMHIVRQRFRGKSSRDEVRRYRELFKQHILANIGKLFPNPE